MPSRAFLRLLALAGLLVAASASTYTLRWGDTLTGVAQRFRVAVSTLARANDIADPDQVRAGRTLRVPTDSAAPAGAGGTATHVVRPGENLTSIARRYATTTSRLRALNQLADPDFLREGQRLVVAGSAEPTVAGATPIAATVSLPQCPVAGAGPWDVSDGYAAPRPGGFRHEGNDIFARRGTPVVAPAGGTLRLVQGQRAGNAFYLTADDGTVYYGAHLQSYAAGSGPVEAGRVIGGVGNSGDAAATPPHLHFEVKPGGGPAVDPNRALRAVCRG